MKNIIECKVNGVVGHGYHKGKRISAMCGAIKCSSNECSLEMGECEHQSINKGSEKDS